MRNLIQTFVLFCIALFFAGCGGFTYKVTHTPTYMCTGDDVSVSARISDKVDRIRVYDNQGVLWKSRTNAKRIAVNVPNLQSDQLQFTVRVKEGDVKKRKATEIDLFDNPMWVNGDGITPSYLDNKTDISSYQLEAQRNEQICMEWDDEGGCLVFERVSSSKKCYAVHEVYYTYKGATWSLSSGVDYSNRIKASHVKNLTSQVITVRPGAESVRSVNAGNVVSFTPVAPGAVEVKLQIPPALQDKKLCAKVTELRNCGSSSTFNKEYLPDFEDCIGPLPVIDMKLFCEQP